MIGMSAMKIRIIVLHETLAQKRMGLSLLASGMPLAPASP
jgi:hypothetical protein